MCRVDEAERGCSFRYHELLKYLCYNLDKECTQDDPVNECCYDESRLLVTPGHLYEGCKGSPDQYDQTKYPLRHTILDSGGIIRSGGPAFRDSNLHNNIRPWNEEHPNIIPLIP